MEEALLQKKEGYQIKLSNFEGPLDLLLYLIKKNEVDIYDINVSEITRQYLDYIELMKILDLEVAGEFILMAATLIRIKAKMLLPKDPDAFEEDEEDPRTDLVKQLLEYKRFKEVAEDLSDKEDHQRRLYPRRNFQFEKQYIKDFDDTADLVSDISLFDLLSAFKYALENRPVDTAHEVGELGATVEDQINYIIGYFDDHERVTFSDLVKPLKTRLMLIVTFIAILELIKTHRLMVQQARVFGDIYITKT